MAGSKFLCDIDDLLISREVGGLTWRRGLKWARKLQDACVLIRQPDGHGVQMARFENGRWTIEA